MNFREQIGIRILKKLNVKLSELSQLKGISKNSFILNILWEFIEKEEKEKCMDQ